MPIYHLKTAVLKIASLLILMFALSNCANNKTSIFSSSIHSQIHKVWNISRLSVYRQQLYTFTPVLDGDVVYFTSARGVIYKADINNGKILDKISTTSYFSSGLAMKYNTLFATTTDAKLIAIDKISHKIIWQSDLPTIAIEAPIVNNNTVIIKSNDGKILTFNIDDGKKIWIYDSNPPNLTLYNNRSMTIVDNDFLLSGFANGNIAIFNINNGVMLWEQNLSNKNTNEKLKDINNQPLINNDKIFITNYLGGIYCLDLLHGNIIWSKDINGSISAISVNNQNVDIANSYNNNLYHFDQNSGKLIWKKQFKQIITQLINFDNYLLAVDVKGYVHLIDPNNFGLEIEKVKIAPTGNINILTAPNSYGLILQGQNSEISLLNIY